MPRDLQIRPVLGLVVLVALCLGAAALGAALTTPEIDGWYRTIGKPAWNTQDALDAISLANYLR
jgi:tryptophan-rich sensory protein